MSGFGKENKGQILYDQARLTIGALASDTGVIMGGRFASAGLDDPFRIMRMKGFASIWDEEGGDGGPYTMFLVDGDLTLAQVEECIEGHPDSKGDTVALEQSHRPVFPLCHIPTPPHAAADVANTGKAVCVPFDETIRWTFNEGATEGFDYVCYNHGGQAGTASQVAVVFSKIYGVWL